MNSECRTFATDTPRAVFIYLTLLLAVIFPNTSFGGNFYPGVSPTNVFWPGGTVPYVFDTNITATERVTYLDGLREWELAAKIHFIPHTTETNWILFKYAPGTFLDQFVPYTTPETVTVSVLSRGQVCHEMGHALGFNHENIRVDKDTYITVLTNNISPASNIIWFTIDPATTPYGPYDYESVMHLANNFSSIDPSNLYTQIANPPYQSFQPFMGNFALSAGDRASAAYLYGPPTAPLTNVVTTTADVGPGSLRAAIYYGIDHPGSTIRFNIPTNDIGYSNGVYTIYVTGFLPPLVTDGTIIDASTQPGFSGKPLIFIDGSQIIPEAYPPGQVTGLYMYAANCQLKALAFQNFGWNGITIDYPGATNNTITGCWSGVDYTGTNAAPNALQGILIYNGASRNIIGPGNVFSGNTQYGVFITGPATTGNIVRGNHIGCDANGTVSLSDIFGGAIVTVGAGSNFIGPSNLISGNSYFGLWVDSDYNTIQGNWIGLDATGTNALANDFGMFVLFGAQSNLIASNVISGNYAEGFRLYGAGTSFNVVQGNMIGTDKTGMTAVPNGFGGMTFFGGPTSNTVGGSTAAARNIISGNFNDGVVLGDPGTIGNVVEGNYIGLASNGIAPLPNDTGVEIENGAQSNSVTGNVISGNFTSGVFVTNAGTSGNVVSGNFIGLGPDGITPTGNGWQGVVLRDGAAGNIIGTGNRIACNGFEGIAVYESNTVGDTFRGNNIFSNGYLGINLVGGTEDSFGVTANHTGAASGPNDLQNYPAITNVFTSGANTIVDGTLNSTASRTFWIDCYRNIVPDPSGHGEGQFYAGAVSVTTDGSGNATFSFSASGNFAGQYFSTTATDQTTGDTSEFSANVVATNGPAPPAFVGLFTDSTNGFDANLALTIGQSYHVQVSTNLANPLGWTNVTNFVAGATNVNFLDHTATNFHARFYRVISP